MNADTPTHGPFGEELTERERGCWTAGHEAASLAPPALHADGSCDFCCDRCDQHRLAVHYDGLGDGWCVPCVVDAARRDALAPVLALHQQSHDDALWCDHDGFTWPCATYRAAVESPDPNPAGLDGTMDPSMLRERARFYVESPEQPEGEW